jgi:hypothetical protein
MMGNRIKFAKNQNKSLKIVNNCKKWMMAFKSCLNVIIDFSEYFEHLNLIFSNSFL